MSTKKPKYNVQMRHYDYSEGTVLSKVKYFINFVRYRTQSKCSTV